MRLVVNTLQAHRLLAAVQAQGNRGERMVAFFAVMYYAALRPEEAVDLHRHHIDTYGARPDGRLFVGPRGGIMTDRTYLAVWHKARREALTAREAASPLAETPYALRHAAVSTWLAAGVPPQQVAAWAGHSVRLQPATRAS